MPLDSLERSVKPAVPEADDIPLYAPHEKVYPRKVQGPVRRIKWAVLTFCLAVYYLAPWLRWDRGFGRPDQALLIDLPARRAYFFAIEIWPQEIYYITGLLILGAIGLFFVTSLFGRLWCGFSCPQTVWTDLFLWAERLVEGDRTARIRLDQQPLSAAKVAKKALKHAIWLLIAMATGGAWVMYFNDAPTVVRELATFQASAAVYGFFGLFTATTYVLAGWAREQVCTYMCPWPRFQSAMVDEETLTVTYRAWRGEKRGPHKKGQSWEGRGDCVDCKACVSVCPTGIDIRDGLQLECIGCGLCIDACDDIMGRVDRPRGLIAFDTYANQAAALRGEPARPFHLIRPRTIVYVVVLVAAGLAMLYQLLTRSSFDVGVIADRSPLFVTMSDGSIRDSFTIKISNMTAAPRYYSIRATGLVGSSIAVEGIDWPETPAAEGIAVEVGPDQVGTFRAHLRVPRGFVKGEAQFSFVVRAADDDVEITSRPTTFHGPAK